MRRILRRVLSFVPSATLAGTLIGCTADSGDAIAGSFESPEACSFPPGPSRWAGGGPYRETARVGERTTYGSPASAACTGPVMSSTSSTWATLV